MSTIHEKLRAPFSPEKVSWRVGSTNKDKTKGMALAYIDARDVMERLDEVLGPGSWQDRYEQLGTSTVCYLSVRVDSSEWVTKSDGAGDTEYEAEKGRISDAFKRAAVKWGIGRYLYDVGTPWVEIEPVGAKGFRIAQHEYARLRKILPARIEGEEAPAVEPPAVTDRIDHGEEITKGLIHGINMCLTEEDMTEFARENAYQFRQLTDAQQKRVKSAKDKRLLQISSAQRPLEAAE